MPMKPDEERIAVARLLLPTGECLTRQVLTLREGRVVHREALLRELPFTAWHSGTWRLDEAGRLQRV